MGRLYLLDLLHARFMMCANFTTLMILLGSSRREEPSEDEMPYNSKDVFSEDDE